MLDLSIKEIIADAMTVEDLRGAVRRINVVDVNTAIKIWKKASNRIEQIIPVLGHKNLELAQLLLDVWREARECENDFHMLAYLLEQKVIPIFVDALQQIYETVEYSTDRWYFANTPVGFFTVKDKYNNSYIHNPYDPMYEASELAESLYSTDMDEFHILGCGLGYLAYQIWEKSARSAHIYVYEENAAMVQYAYQIGVLSLIDVEKLTVVTDSDVDRMLELFFEGAFDNKDNHYVSDWKKGTYDGSKYATRIHNLDYNGRTCRLFKNLIEINKRENINHESYNLADITNIAIFSDKECVVVSAGPSLDDNIDFIRNSKGKRNIIAVNTVLKRLYQEGIVPDISVALDPKVIMRTHLDGIEAFTEKIPLIAPISVSHTFISAYRGPVYFISDDSNDFEWEFGGTVASLGLDVAYYLNATKVYMIGSDLAYSGDRNFADGVAHGEKEGMLNSIMVESTDGSMVATEYLYNEYRGMIERQIYDHPDVPVINMSEHGALIKGTLRPSEDETLI